jgi:hypothetical protein
MYLYVDSRTRRIAYCSDTGETPKKVLILDNGTFNLFSNVDLQKTSYDKSMPTGFCAQNCWQYRYDGHTISLYLEGDVLTTWPRAEPLPRG